MVSISFFFSFLLLVSSGLIFFIPTLAYLFLFSSFTPVLSILWFPFFSFHHLLLSLPHFIPSPATLSHAILHSANSFQIFASGSLKRHLPFTLPILFGVPGTKRPEVMTRCKQTFLQTYLTCDSFSQINLVDLQAADKCAHVHQHCFCLVLVYKETRVQLDSLWQHVLLFSSIFLLVSAIAVNASSSTYDNFLATVFDRHRQQRCCLNYLY